MEWEGRKDWLAERQVPMLCSRLRNMHFNKHPSLPFSCGFFYFILFMLGIELKSLHVLGQCSITELYLQP
jgi:hypothetical protein